MSVSTRLVVIVVAALLVIVGLMVLVLAATDDVFGLLDGELSARASYVAVFLFIAGDALLPIFPGESTLNAAAVLASDGSLELGPVIVAGALGAIVGDNALYWIARGSRRLVQGQLERLQKDDRVKWVLQILGRRAPMLIVFGRYLPGLRFFVNASMGILPLPYGQFLLWTLVGGVLWSTYTSLLAYFVGSALDGYPLASMIIAGAITTALIAVIYWFDLRRGATSEATSA